MYIEPPLDPPDQTRPDLNAEVGVHGLSHDRVGSGASRESNEWALTDEEMRAFSDCVPPALQVMDAPSAKRVAFLCLERLAAGWKPFEIRRTLDSPLPAQVRRMGGLVVARLEDYVLPDSAPALMRERQAQAQREREESIFASVEEHAPDPDFVAFMADVEERFPDLSAPDKARMWLSYSREVLEAAHV